MKNQETNNNNNQKSGCTFYFKNGTTQFVPDASLKVLRDILKDVPDSEWLAFGDKVLIRIDQIVEVFDNNSEEEETDK